MEELKSMNSSKEDKILVFLQQVSPRIGPANAVNMLKDVHLQAYRQLFIELGVSEAHITEVIDAQLSKMAQNILKMPVPSPIQKL